MDHNYPKYVIAGAGFFGAVIAERIASDLNENVLIIEKRPHIGGNCYSYIDKDTGIDIHKYGSHIFHTKIETVWKYINRFAIFNNYRHQVLGNHNGVIYPLPINLDTINRLFGLTLTPVEVEAFLRGEANKSTYDADPSFESYIVSRIGTRLYDAFIKNYTVKQWGIHPSQLPESIIKRLPIRSNYNQRYFDDPWEGIPVSGYTSIFDNLLAHKNIQVKCNTDFLELKDEIPADRTVIYTGPIDEFFNYKYGLLKWRTLDFEQELIDIPDYQGTTVINYTDGDVPFTRIHEFKHYHPEAICKKDVTIIFKEYSRAANRSDEKYYPLNTVSDAKILKQYEKAGELLKNYYFGGRLGGYKYFDMDRTINAALELYSSKLNYVR